MVFASLARRAATRALRAPAVNGAVRALARARGHGLILVYHAITEDEFSQSTVVPSIPSRLFRAQLQALGDNVDLIPLDRILADDDRRAASSLRPRVAITFDDDLPSHCSVALPLLCDLGVRAAFFLSGRALHGAGPYWFQQLDTLIAAHGSARTAALLGVPDDGLTNLTLACERHAYLRRQVARLAADFPSADILDRAAIARLAAARMNIGFHTVDHESLPEMDDAAIDVAVRRGREPLSAAAGAPLRYFAYPHGKADVRSAAAVRRAGFDAAFTGRPRPLRPRTDRYRLGRWDAGPRSVDDFLVHLALRLHRAAPCPPEELA